MKLSDKVAIITGAARGIGKAIALGLASEGARVMVTNVDAAAAAKVAQEIIRSGGSANSFQLDVTRKDQVFKVVREILDNYGRIDILVNNAGVVSTERFIETSEAEWDRIMNVNLKGAYYCCQAVIPGMIGNQSGKIVNIASVAAKLGGGLLGNTAYAASKAGLIGMSKGLARELAPFGINVNIIAPGSINTDMTAKHLTQQQQLNSIARIPLGRRGNVQDIVGAAILLASSDSDFMAGATIDINGGVLMD